MSDTLPNLTLFATRLSCGSFSGRSAMCRGILAVVLLLLSVGCPRDTAEQETGESHGDVRSRPKPAIDDPDSSASGEQTAGDENHLPVLFDAPAFALTDQTGNSFGSTDLSGQVWIANFMFTRCAATCPRQTAVLTRLQERLSRWPDRQHVRFVSFTVDPAFDSVEVLRDYADLHGVDGDRWKFLTGPRDELWETSVVGFKLPVGEAAADASTPFTHSARFVLVDARSRVRGYYDALADIEVRQLVGDIRKLLSEDTGDPSRMVHIGHPPAVIDPEWIDERRSEQLENAADIDAFTDFAFTDRIEESGIEFVHRATHDAGKYWKPNHYDHGNGIAVADVDGDGLSDVYFVSQVGPNGLWRNLGEGRFEDITDEAGVGLADRIGVTASFADTDNDGDPDLMVTTVRHGNAFFENEGQGRFRDITVEAGLDYSGHSSSIEFFDFDRDGLLDIFLTNVGIYTTDEVEYHGDPEQQEEPYYVGIRDAFGGHLFPSKSERSILYRNEGQNRFHDVSEQTGLLDESWSGDATPLDVNRDGWLDLYIVNMQGNDEYYENVEGKRFERRSREVFPKTPWGAMGVKSFDYNNDGRMEIYVTDMHSDMWELSKGILGSSEKERPADNVMPESYLRSGGMSIFGNAFFVRRDEDAFEDVALEVNAENFWPWGLSVGDLNADGFLDAFVCSCMNLPFRYHVNSLLLNERGERFRDAEFVLGVEPRRDGRTAAPWYELDCSGADAGHDLCADREGRVVVWGAIGTRSAAIFDIDRDGDLDIVTNDFHTRPMVLISNLSDSKPDLNFLEIRLEGRPSNRDGLGSRVEVHAGDRVFTQVHDGQSGYLSQSSLPLYFGLGSNSTVEQVVIEWPSGTRQTLAGPIKTNQRLTVTESESP